MWWFLFLALLLQQVNADLCNPNPCFTGHVCTLTNGGASYSCSVAANICNSTDAHINLQTCVCNAQYYDIVYGQNSQLGVTNATCSQTCLNTGTVVQNTDGSYGCECYLYGNYYGASCQYCTVAQNDTGCLQPTTSPSTTQPATTITPTPTTLHATDAPTSSFFANITQPTYPPQIPVPSVTFAGLSETPSIVIYSFLAATILGVLVATPILIYVYVKKKKPVGYQMVNSK